MSYESQSGFGFGFGESLGDETAGLLGRPSAVQVTSDLPAGPSTGGVRPQPIALRPGPIQVTGGSGGPSTGGARPAPIAQPYNDGAGPSAYPVKMKPQPAMPIFLGPLPAGGATQDPSGTCGPCAATGEIPWLWIALASAAGLGIGYVVKQEMDKKKKGAVAA